MKVSFTLIFFLTVALGACSAPDNVGQRGQTYYPPSKEITPELLTEIVVLLKKNRSISKAYAVQTKNGHEYILVPEFDQKPDMTSLYEIESLFNSRVSDTKLSVTLLTPEDRKALAGNLAPFYARR